MGLAGKEARFEGHVVSGMRPVAPTVQAALLGARTLVSRHIIVAQEVLRQLCVVIVAAKKCRVQRL